jgi:hypothetical protein
MMAEQRTQLYDPYSKVGATSSPTPYMHISRPDVTFTDAIGKALGELGKGVSTLGGAQIQVGSALAHFGGSLEGAGDEIFKRASAIKAVENDTAATEASVKFHIEGNKMTEAYEATKGNQTTGSLDAHMKTLEDTRQKIRTSLNNDQARNMFDQSSLKTLGGLVAKAGHHAANAGKSAARSAADAEEKIQLNNIVLNANEPGFDFESEVNTAMTRYREKIAAVDGDFGPVKELKEKELFSRLYSSWATGKGKINPEEGYAILEDAKAKGRIMAADYEKVKSSLRSNDIDITSRMIADKATAPLRGNKTEEERLNEPTKEQAVANALEELKKHPRLNDDPSVRAAAEEYTAARTARKYEQEESLRKNNIMMAERKIQAVIAGTKSPTKERPKDWDEFLAQGGKEIEAELAKLPFKKQMYYKDKVASQDHLDSPEIQMEFARQKAMASDTSNPEAIRKVLETNYFDKKWPMEYIVKMYNEQEKILKGEHKNIPLDHAMTIAKGYGLPESLKDDPNQMYGLRAAMEANLLRHQQIFKTLPTDEKIREFTKEWLRTESKTGWFGMKDYSFQPDNAWLTASKKKNPTWSDEERAAEYRLEKSSEILKKVYKGAPPVGEGPALRWFREHGGFGQ